MTTTMDLADDLGVDERDVDVLLEQLGESETNCLTVEGKFRPPRP